MGSSQKRKMIRFFFVFDTLKNNTSKGKGKAKYKELGGGQKEKRIKKNRGCALSFYIGYFGNSFCPKISA